MPGRVEVGVRSVERVGRAQPGPEAGRREVAGFEPVEQLGLAGLRKFDGAARAAQAAHGGGGGGVVDVDENPAKIKQ